MHSPFCRNISFQITKNLHSNRVMYPLGLYVGESQINTVYLILQLNPIGAHNLVESLYLFFGQFLLSTAQVLFELQDAPKHIDEVTIGHIELEDISRIGPDLQGIHPDLLLHGASGGLVTEHFMTELRDHFKYVSLPSCGQTCLVICGRMAPYVTHTYYSN